jgi:hypothetical protein
MGLAAAGTGPESFASQLSLSIMGKVWRGRKNLKIHQTVGFYQP